MTGAEAAFWAFLVSAFVYGFISIREARHIHTVNGFFHDSRLTKNALSYTAANITLGTGLIYIASAIGSLGALFLLSPLMMLAGYRTLAAFLRSQAPEDLFADNMIKGLSQSIDVAMDRDSGFARAFTVVITAVFALVLAFEIFASAKLLASLMFLTPGPRHEVFVGSAVFAVALLYTLWGGYRAVQTTDLAQLVLIGILIATLWIVLARAIPIADTTHGPAPLIPPITRDVIMGAIAAALGAFTTQFYSLLNLCAATQQNETETRSALLRKIGLYTFVALSILVIGALWLSVSKDLPFALLNASIQHHVKGSNPTDLLLSVIMMLGMSAVLFSTVDTLIVSLTRFSYSNLFNRNAKDDTHNSPELRVVRLSMLALGPSVFALLALVWYRQPELFGLLLAIVSGNDVLVPLLVLLVLLHKRGRMKSLKGPRGIPLFWPFFLLFALAVVSAVVFSLLHLPYTRYVGPLGFLLSAGLAIVILKRKT